MSAAHALSSEPDMVAYSLELARENWLHALDAVAAHEKVVAPYFASAFGRLGDASFQMETRSFETELYRQLVVAEIRDASGAMKTLTVVGLPRVQTSAPIVGVDLIGLRGALTLCAFDLAPTHRSFWNLHCRGALQRVSCEVDGLPRRKLPDFAKHTFSKDVVIVAAKSGQESSIAAAASSLAQSFVELSQAASLWRFPHAAVAISEWCESELQNRKEAAALGRLFGPEFAAAYLHTFLFNTEAYI